MDPKALRYTPTHEWARLEGGVCTVGITKFAADQLTDITYLELPAVGKHYGAGDDFGKVETVKAVSDLYAPVAGTVTAVNDKVRDDPNILLGDPFGAGWIVKMQLDAGTTLDKLLTLEQYEKQLASEGH
jgi:glycine cleavage system H protein